MSDHRPPRVRVTAPRRRSGASRRPLLSATSEIDAQTEVGRIFVSSLVQAQLRLTGVLLGALVLLLGGMPLVLLTVPATSAVQIGGMPVGWFVVGAGIYPVLVLLGAVYVRRAERIEQNFADVAQAQRERA